MRTFIALICLLATLGNALAQTNFVQVTNAAPVIDVFDAAGCALVDYDNDGYVDLFVANITGPNRLYHNQGNGGFERISTGPIVNEAAHESYGVAWGDFDNDGLPDLFVANGGVSGSASFLYHNDGDGNFTKVTNNLVASVHGYFIAGAWADYDRDGLIDLFVANNHRSGSPSLLYHNDGRSSFSLANSTLSAKSDAIAGAWADYNGDGWPDLLVANGFLTDHQTNFLYANLGGGAFNRVVDGSFPSPRLGSYAVAWGDYDNDGFLDVLVANDGNNLDEGIDRSEPNELYHNNGDGTFTRLTAGPIATDQSFSTTVAWADYDNDGWLDLFVGSRTYDYSKPQPSFLYHNNGDGTFTRIATGPIAEYVGSTGGCAWGDYDNDGFLDLFVSSPALQHGGRNALFHNTGNTNAWLKVRCIGTVSNRMGIGAKVRVKAWIGGKMLWQLREITSGDGIGSSGLIAHFGLGSLDNRRVEEVQVEWPSGVVQTLSSAEVSPNSYLTVTEPRTQVVVWGADADRWNGVQLTNGIAITSNGIGLNADGTVVGLVSWAPVGLSDVVAIAGGEDFSLALRADGTIVTWGQEPGMTVPLPPPDLTKVIAISVSFAGDCLALKSDGTVTAWGDQMQPAPPGLSNVVAIAAGPAYYLALTAGGRVVDWGTDGSVKPPTDLDDVVAIAAGNTYGLALKSDETVVSWGHYPETFGGGTTSVNPPAGVSNVVAIAAAPRYSLALKLNGTVVEWGLSGETDNPTLLITNVVNIDLGTTNVIAITAYPSVALVGDSGTVLRGLMAHPTLDAAGFSVSVPSQSGRVYRLEYSRSLDDSGWHALPLVPGNGTVLRLIDDNPSDTTRFYRVRRW